MVKLCVFDFDGTLFRSPVPNEAVLGKGVADHVAARWQAGGLGWFQSPLSLTPPFVPDIPDAAWFDPWVLRAMQRAVAEGHVVAVMSGREQCCELRMQRIVAAAVLTTAVVVRCRPQATSSIAAFKVDMGLQMIREFAESRGITHAVFYDDDPSKLNALRAHLVPRSCVPVRLQRVHGRISFLDSSLEQKLIAGLQCEADAFNASKNIITSTPSTIPAKCARVGCAHFSYNGKPTSYCCQGCKFSGACTCASIARASPPLQSSACARPGCPFVSRCGGSVGFCCKGCKYGCRCSCGVACSGLGCQKKARDGRQFCCVGCSEGRCTCCARPGCCIPSYNGKPTSFCCKGCKYGPGCTCNRGAVPLPQPITAPCHHTPSTYITFFGIEFSVGDMTDVLALLPSDLRHAARSQLHLVVQYFGATDANDARCQPLQSLVGTSTSVAANDFVVDERAAAVTATGAFEAFYDNTFVPHITLAAANGVPTVYVGDSLLHSTTSQWSTHAFRVDGVYRFFP